MSCMTVSLPRGFLKRLVSLHEFRPIRLRVHSLYDRFLRLFSENVVEFSIRVFCGLESSFLWLATVA